MNEHDRDLILALTEGTLTDDEAAAARARIEADPALAAELAGQESVRSRLRDLPDVAMTAAERSDLRSSLVAHLQLDAAAAREPAATADRWSAWWRPVVGIAAAAVFVTAVIVVVPGALDGGDDSGGEALTATTTTEASDGVEEFTGLGDSGDDEAAVEEDTGDAADGADTTITEETVTTTVAEAAATAEVPTFEDVDGADLLEVTEGADTPEEVIEPLARVAPVQGTTMLDVAEVEACLETLGATLPPGDKVPVGAELEGDRLLVYLASDPGAGVDAIVTIDLARCSLVDIAE